MPMLTTIGLDVGGTGARGVLTRFTYGEPPADPAQPGGGGGEVGPPEAGPGPLGEPRTVARAARDIPNRVTAGGVDAAHLGEVLGAIVTELLDAAGLTRVDAIGMGSAGAILLGGEIRRALPGVLRAWADEVVLASDALTSYVGALGLSGGAVVAAGTGAVAVGTDLRGAWNRVDGWGHLLGDAGGGAWIGRAGLEAALRAGDGRAGGSALLLMALESRFGGPKDLVAAIYTRPDRAGLLASFVPDVVTAAESGDLVARDILTRAGAHLAETALAALPPDAPRRISTAGNLIPAIPLLRESFAAAVSGHAVLLPPRSPSTEGAATLAAAARLGSLPPGITRSGLFFPADHAAS
ncbi:N-acetylglucosamine kinase [Bailinhaonella thermotolerans]|nr:BadF/BadG/BcrA/BcrD ATPase family protein [Bailinhaonella thermotolerans]